MEEEYSIFTEYYSVKKKVQNFLISYYERTYSLLLKSPPICRYFAWVFTGCMPFYLLYLFYMYKLQTRVLSYLSLYKLSLAFYICYGVQILLLILILYLKPAQIKRNEITESYIELHRREIIHVYCKFCNLTKPMRSYHCVYCNKCLAKWEEHSYYFNRCIDARNNFVYWLYLIICIVINVMSIVSCVYYNSIRVKGMPKAFLYIFLLLIQFFTLSKEFFIYTRSIAMNITLFEMENLHILIYMWKNNRQEFFNPFDRSIFHNFMQAIKSTFTTINELTLCIVLNNNIAREDTESESIIGNDIIKAYDGTWDPDWRIYRIYNVLDVLNSPMRQTVMPTLIS